MFEETSLSCGHCSFELSPKRSFPKCSQCRESYHFKCIKGIHQSTWRGLTKLQKDLWRCEKCAGNDYQYLSNICNRDSSRSSKESSRSPSSSRSVTLKRQLEFSSPDDNHTGNNPKRAANTIVAMASASEIRSIMSEELEKFKMNMVEEIRKEFVPQMQQLKNENAELKQQVTRLEEKVAAVQNHCNNQEQYSKRNEVILSGIPTQKDENTPALISNICQKVQMTLQPWEVLAAHRLPKRKNGDIPIIVKFHRRDFKEALIKKIKQADLKASMFGGKETVKIYANEHLTRDNQKLFQKSRELLYYGYRYVWTRNGNTFVREKEQSPIHKIENEDQINELMKNRTRTISEKR